MDTLRSKKVNVHEAVMIRYADDTVILSKSSPEKYMGLAEMILDLLGLEVNAGKSKVPHIINGFDFLDSLSTEHFIYGSVS